MNKRLKTISIFNILFMLLICLIYTFSLQSCSRVEIQESQTVQRLPRIDPDYKECTIPPNIAPLNFIIKEPGERYYVKIVSVEGKNIEILSNKSNIRIPIKRWKKLLSMNRGQEIHFNIYVMNQNGNWSQFESITNYIALEKIDNFLAYRLINPAHNFWGKMGIYQRNLQNYSEEPILLNRITQGNCMNCHSFCNNNPDYMLFHMRGGPASGMILAQGGKITKVNTSTEFNKAGSYPSWHPNRKLLALSVNKLRLFFHAIGESRDVLDLASDLILYKIDSNIITTCPQISNPERLETFPSWSPDGKYLYFCSAPKYESFLTQEEDLLYDQILYDLMRIRYHAEDGTWGDLETVLLASATGLSITMPRISPDGRYLLFCMAEYGNFPIYMNSSDLYIMDLSNGQYYRPDINSNRPETFHSWSSNSRWFVFSSKKRDGLCARPYFSYIDKSGKVHKPFIMPQKDPTFYSTFLKTYNVPELVKDPVKISWRKLTSVAFNNDAVVQARLDPNVKFRRTTIEEEESKWKPAPQ